MVRRIASTLGYLGIVVAALVAMAVTIAIDAGVTFGPP